MLTLKSRPRERSWTIEDRQESWQQKLISIFLFYVWALNSTGWLLNQWNWLARVSNSCRLYCEYLPIFLAVWLYYKDSGISLNVSCFSIFYTFVNLIFWSDYILSLSYWALSRLSLSSLFLALYYSNCNFSSSICVFTPRTLPFLEVVSRLFLFRSYSYFCNRARFKTSFYLVTVSKSFLSLTWSRISVETTSSLPAGRLISIARMESLSC
jgi:hypothetical protein